jgi:pyruvate/2-oxoacid:ferredoxin oxidoreductase beta subunit
MHTQLGSSGAAALGTSGGLKALMRKGKMKSEPINVIAFCGDGGGADMGLNGISATLTHKDYNCLILMYDNESYANTDIQLSAPRRTAPTPRSARPDPCIGSSTRAGRRTPRACSPPGIPSVAMSPPWTPPTRSR